MLQLLVCDDSPGARETIRVMLADHPEIEIVADAADGESAVALAAACSPDVVLMDVAMAGMGGVAATRKIRELLPAVRIVAFSGCDDGGAVRAMMEAGASAYCVKGAPLWELERAIAGASDPLVRLANDLARSVHGRPTGELVARELADLSGAALAATYLASPDVGLSLAGAAGTAAAAGPVAAPGVVLRAFGERTLTEADPHELAELFRLGVASGEAVAVPLMADGEALGALLVVLPADAHSEIDTKLVCDVADLAAASVAAERRLSLSFAEARRDAVTGLANRRAFDEHLDRALRDAQERGRQVALVLLDLDDFKRINDEEGHAAGDETLYEVGRVMLRSLRAEEQAFRIGGDEFAILIEDGSETATIVAERIRAALLRQDRGRVLPTVSAGVATLPGDARTRQELLHKADFALYGAKRAGKNRVSALTGDLDAPAVAPAEHGAAAEPEPAPARDRPVRILIVDDDPGLRMLLRTTFEVIDLEVEEADSAASAAARIARRPPDVLVLDVGLPGTDGLTFCRTLKADPATGGIGIVLLTGSDVGPATIRESGADALLRKPFSPLELLTVIERLAGGLEAPTRTAPSRPPEEQVIFYAQDLRRMLEVERGQRALVQRAYRQTVAALAAALESKDTGTGAHSHRVQRYAMELVRSLEPGLLGDESVEYGFLLHDVGKIGIPDRVLLKQAPLTKRERQLMETHTVLGEQMLGEVDLLHGEGLKVVRWHHERWDGKGYPDGLTGADIPIAARVFAVADALDAMTSDRPYRSAGTWDAAVTELVAQAGRQFDPDVIDSFREREPAMRRIHAQLAAS
jgi:diguanylate cyclase (GGDEF)-like protein